MTNNVAGQKQLTKAVALQLHAQGIVVSEIGPAVTRLLDRNWDNTVHDWRDEMNEVAGKPSKSRNLQVARKLIVVLKDVLAHGLCAQPMEEDYATKILKGGYKTDTSLMLAVHARIAPAGGPQYRLTSVMAWGEFDRNDSDVEQNDRDVTIKFTAQAQVQTQAQAQALNAFAAAGDVAEIDLVCAAAVGREAHGFWHVRGAGRVLLMHALLKIAARTKTRNHVRGPRYRAVVTYLASDPAVNNGTPPLRSAVEAMGFVRAPARYHPRDGGASYPSPREYWVLKAAGNAPWQTRLAAAVAWDDTLAEKLCPLTTGTGLTYCQ